MTPHQKIMDLRNLLFILILGQTFFLELNGQSGGGGLGGIGGIIGGLVTSLLGNGNPPVTSPGTSVTSDDYFYTGYNATAGFSATFYDNSNISTSLNDLTTANLSDSGSTTLPSGKPHPAHPGGAPGVTTAATNTGTFTFGYPNTQTFTSGYPNTQTGSTQANNFGGTGTGTSETAATQPSGPNQGINETTTISSITQASNGMNTATPAGGAGTGTQGTDTSTANVNTGSKPTGPPGNQGQSTATATLPQGPPVTGTGTSTKSPQNTATPGSDKVTANGNNGNQTGTTAAVIGSSNLTTTSGLKGNETGQQGNGNDTNSLSTISNNNSNSSQLVNATTMAPLSNTSGAGGPKGNCFQCLGTVDCVQKQSSDPSSCYSPNGICYLVVDLESNPQMALWGCKPFSRDRIDECALKSVRAATYCEYCCRGDMCNTYFNYEGLAKECYPYNGSTKIGQEFLNQLLNKHYIAYFVLVLGKYLFR